MKTDTNILLTKDAIVGCAPIPGSGLRFLVLSHMGTHSDDRPAEMKTAANGLGRLTPRELEVCVLHLADGWSQETVADWLGLSRRTVQFMLASATRKVPPLQRLHARATGPARRPRIVHLSQIGSAERGPFDADDL